MVRIGYPCINNCIGCTSSRTFRLASYSDERLIETVQQNLDCLRKILEYNVQHNLLFFRMSSDIVPFASHEVNQYNWQNHFKLTFKRIGDYIKKHNMRISMHPDQFVVINSPNPEIVQRSVAELVYQGSVMDLMELDQTAKLQIHGGGVYGDKEAAMERFIKTYHELPEPVKKRLCIENDDRLYTLKDCLYIHDNTGIPIIFDNFHHECNNNGEPMAEAVAAAAATWGNEHGPFMMDYSSQSPGERKGKHITSIREDLFREFLPSLNGIDADIMLEIKDKEASAVKALAVLEEEKLV
ncbi:MAG: UV DNA damage repair endonuclease UvsE [Hymenobacteraceae bacterium]|nr:UV DNA damage repair endonuclease UvsE [Hymenobacteraceae bacterium]MDX5394735.1 UV DNA damage repair endonuclease UvsE [Hymenobacteraceae bacterium]MDX5443529.1 UV DNA damage repair endonuclease UvsE [Hymenobacteraceae bacterium]MDX5510768.1 UV DNA damage repair endonuclease UvsE [Hymenobacteraceae bacterium]